MPEELFQKCLRYLQEAAPEETNSPSSSPKKQAEKIINTEFRELKEKLEILWRDLSWSPHIAFYGETNAGKSTLIVALRLYFGEKYKDVGKTIGDGRSDFTRESKSYPCSFEGKKFDLIDVPGIEGAEEKVENAIRHALGKSQSVFYITPDARPPQSGDKEKTGREPWKSFPVI